mgnify:CR=1 FL=1
MNFRDFNNEGPGTFEWDYVLGGNTTGLFPEGGTKNYSFSTYDYVLLSEEDVEKEISAGTD